MENGGNKKVNLIFEARLNASKPSNTATGPVRERFIRDKYERRKFYDPNAFAAVEEMTASSDNHHHASTASSKEGEQRQVIAGVQRRLQQSQIRKPSDAARKRVEERAARSRGGVDNANGANRTATRGKNAVKTPPSRPNNDAPPAVDLLDFGDFDSPEATEAAVASVGGGGAPSASADVPALDLFSQMSVGGGNADNSTGAGHVNAAQGMMPSSQQPQQQQQQPKMSTADIMNMFNTPNPNNVMQQNMFAMGGGIMQGGGNNAMTMNQNAMNGMSMGMSGGGNMMNSVGNYGNNMMPSNNNFGGNTMMNNGMGMPTTGNMMGVGNNNMMMGTMNNNQMNMMNNPMMHPQQQQFQGQIPMNGMQQGSGGGMMAGGNQFGQASSPMATQQQQVQAPRQTRGTSHDQFAEFGNFGR